jgi:hypothetical protein
VVCEECRAEADDSALGWRGYLAFDPEDGDQPDVAFYCPRCAAREFGPLRLRPASSSTD